MAKATQAGHGDVTKKTPTTQGPITGKCHVCQKTTHVWAWIMRGKAMVCSRRCFNTYKENRYV
jgi:hypothetical protein